MEKNKIDINYINNTLNNLRSSFSTNLNDEILKIASLRNSFLIRNIINDVKSILKKDITETDLIFLYEKSILINSNKPICYKLSDHERNSFLKMFISKEQIKSYLQKLNFDNIDLTQTLFNNYINNEITNLENQSIPELVASYNISCWLMNSVILVPTKEEILYHIKKQELLMTFKKLTQNFKGRISELQKFADYVDFLPKNGIIEKGQHFIRNIIGWHEKPPMLVTGIGGIGKSTLISKFILNHIDSQKETKLPFIFLDFDKSGLSISDPLSLMIEAIRQLSMQFPVNQKYFSEIHQALIQEYSNDLITNPSRSSDRKLFFEKYVLKYIDNINAIKSPILIVLDSFEEVQYRAKPNEIGNLFNILKDISDVFPRIRVVVAGRSEITIPSVEFEKLNLVEFDSESAFGFLKSLNISNEIFIKDVYSKFGGNPLTLQLVADLLKKENLNSATKHTNTSDFYNIRTRNFYFSKINEKSIQEQLVKRNLDHIHDEKVRKIAIPGILVRKINSSVIQNILAEPCGLGVISNYTAEKIFEELKKESFLITEHNGNLSFRQDLRIALYEIIISDSQYKSYDVHSKAIEYYKDKTSAEDKAEYLYHKLKRDNDGSVIDEIYNESIRPFIETSLKEFDADSYLHLARVMGITASDFSLKKSDIEEWEKYRLSEIKDLFRNGDEKHLEDMQQLLEKRKDRTNNGEFNYLESKVYLRLGEFDTAEKIIGKSFKQNSLTNHSDILKLSLLKSKIYEYQLNFEGAFQILFNLEYLFKNLSDVENNKFIANDIFDWLFSVLRLSNRINHFFHKSESFNLLFYTATNKFQDQFYQGNAILLLPQGVNCYFNQQLKFTNREHLEILNAIKNIQYWRSHTYLNQYLNIKNHLKSNLELERYLSLQLNKIKSDFTANIPNYVLFLKDITEPGVVQVNTIDLLNFLELLSIEKYLNLNNY